MREDSGVAPGLMSLPSGGGASPLGDRFEPDLVRGSGGYSVPIVCPKGPNELRPALSLSYSSGSGNGPFGLGWGLNVARIERATDRGLPQYTDADTFSIGDAETLVAVGGGRYRPASDSQFWLIERDGDAWRVKKGDGRVLMFGQTPDTRESDGSDTFAWCLDEETDQAGNSIVYRYLRDGGRLYVRRDRVQHLQPEVQLPAAGGPAAKWPRRLAAHHCPAAPVDRSQLCAQRTAAAAYLLPEL